MFVLLCELFFSVFAKFSTYFSVIITDKIRWKFNPSSCALSIFGAGVICKVNITADQSDCVWKSNRHSKANIQLWCKQKETKLVITKHSMPNDAHFVLSKGQKNERFRTHVNLLWCESLPTSERNDCFRKKSKEKTRRKNGNFYVHHLSFEANLIEKSS